MKHTKKQLLFVCYGLGIGGIEKCLVNLLNVLPEEDCDVDVLLMSPQYTLKPQIRRSVRFYDEFHYVLYSGGAMEEIRRRGGVARNLHKMPAYVLFRWMDQHGGNTWKLFRSLPKTYDVAVAYSQNGQAPYYVIDKVRANRKVMWYHNGAYEKTGKDYDLDRAYYTKFDYLVAVSNDCAAVLKEKFPEAEDRIIVLRNICDRKSIRENAGAFAPKGFDEGRTHIVTIGRMTREKGADLALEACRLLQEAGHNICWHWIGDGDQADMVRKKAEKLGLQDSFILEGNQDNPYPFLRRADIYVQPSYYEAYSTTVTEAKVLEKPIVTTDVGGMRDQLTDGETGIIVPVAAGAIAAGVQRLLEDSSLGERFSQKLKEENYKTDAELEQYRQTVFG